MDSKGTAPDLRAAALSERSLERHSRPPEAICYLRYCFFLNSVMKLNAMINYVAGHISPSALPQLKHGLSSFSLLSFSLLRTLNRVGSPTYKP